jgi:hypothetical protein
VSHQRPGVASQNPSFARRPRLFLPYDFFRFLRRPLLHPYRYAVTRKHEPEPSVARWRCPPMANGPSPGRAPAPARGRRCTVHHRPHRTGRWPLPGTLLAPWRWRCPPFVANGEPRKENPPVSWTRGGLLVVAPGEVGHPVQRTDFCYFGYWWDIHQQPLWSHPCLVSFSWCHPGAGFNGTTRRVLKNKVSSLVLSLFYVTPHPCGITFSSGCGFR